MRASIDLDRLGERTLWVDCDVLEADGGTRTAAITGGSICRLALIVAFSAAGIRDCFLCIVDREYPWFGALFSRTGVRARYFDETSIRKGHYCARTQLGQDIAQQKRGRTMQKIEGR